MRNLHLLTTAAFTLLVTAGALPERLPGEEPLGVRPHYHGFHVGKRHAEGWRYPSNRSSHHGHRQYRPYEYHSYGWQTPYGSGVFSHGRVPYGALDYRYLYPPAVYSAPPVFVPPELHFGPQALDRFLGHDRNAGLRPLAAPQLPGAAGAFNGAVNGGALDGAANGAGAQAGEGEPDENEAIRQAVRQSNGPARERAARFVQFGDNLFAQQRYHEGLQRYKSASQAAPDLAEPYFRQAHALVATNRFELAADAFRRALALDDDVDRQGFRLDDLYGDAELAKASHRDSLARHALDRPGDAEVLFLLGAFLFYDGQRPRAEPFFERAAELLGDRTDFLQPYLDQIEDERAAGLDL